mmetsp:Transcript_11069/g.16871  ORF Transcript_11069/g.16871 Transcript_11069/m.16871 type:complete len:210 (-) Transcript_11069:616-1245(-)
MLKPLLEEFDSVRSSRLSTVDGTSSSDFSSKEFPLPAVYGTNLRVGSDAARLARVSSLSSPETGEFSSALLSELKVANNLVLPSPRALPVDAACVKTGLCGGKSQDSASVGAVNRLIVLRTVFRSFLATSRGFGPDIPCDFALPPCFALESSHADDGRCRSFPRTAVAIRASNSYPLAFPVRNSSLHIRSFGVSFIRAIPLSMYSLILE